MIPRGAPYISWADLGAALMWTFAPGNSKRAQQQVEALWAPNTIAFLSVRSGFDALLRVRAYPRGSEIIVSAITIPHILEIIAKHGLIAIPVDISLETLAPDAADVARAITPRTKAILVTHLFGGRNPIDDLVSLANARGLSLIEDCAQAYDGEYRGHPQSDIRMFSFGPIKRQTALGGGLLTFRAAAEADRVRQLHASYPHQPRSSYTKRIAMMVGIKCLTWRPVFTVFAETCLQLRISHDALLNNALRSFGGHDLFVRLRQQPCFPLLRLLVRRLRQNAAAAIAVRSAVTDRVSEAWPLMAQPGRSMWRRNPWLFPTLSPEPERLRDHLWAHGFDATRGASNLVSVPAPEGHSSPVRAERLMKEILYLPLHPSAKPRELQRLAGVIRTFAETAHETDSSSVAEHDLIHDLQPRLR